MGRLLLGVPLLLLCLMQAGQAEVTETRLPGGGEKVIIGRSMPSAKKQELLAMLQAAEDPLHHIWLQAEGWRNGQLKWPSHTFDIHQHWSLAHRALQAFYRESSMWLWVDTQWRSQVLELQQKMNSAHDVIWAVQVSLGERIAALQALEDMYWKLHRTVEHLPTD